MPIKLIIIFSLITTAITACSVSPTGRSQLMIFPGQQMQVMGVRSFEDILANTAQVENPELENYVHCVADTITGLTRVRQASKNWEVVIFDDPAVNAFALPGGKVGVNKGMLRVATTPGQLAAVIGHEVGHVLARHGNERVSQQFALNEALSLLNSWIETNNRENKAVLMGLLGIGAQVGVTLPFSRVHETEADEIGQILMAKAGFDPNESVRLWKKMKGRDNTGGKSSDLLSTHPTKEARMMALRQGVKNTQVLYEQTKNSPNRPVCRLPRLIQ